MASITPKPGWLGQAATAVGKQTPRLAGQGYLDKKEEPDKPWWQQALTPIVKGPIGMGLQAIDTARSALVSTSKELADLVQGEGFSGSDWLNQTKNHYGFGDLLRDENIDFGKWGNRVVGFIGDVALDPVTYMTFGAGSLAKMGAKEIADQLMEASTRAVAKGAQSQADDLVKAATRVRRTGSKLSAGGNALRHIGHDVGFGFNIPGTGQIGRTFRFDKALDAITGGAISGRRAREWAPFFRQQMRDLGSTKSDEALNVLFDDAVRKGRISARELMEQEAKDLAPRTQFAGGFTPVGGRAAPVTRVADPKKIDDIAEDLLGTVSRASRSRTDIIWRNGKASYELGENVSRRLGGGDNAIIRTIASKPGEGFQKILRGTIGKRFSEGLRRKSVLDEWLMSGNPVKYWAARAIETGDMIGFANKGTWLQAVDQLQGEMLTQANRAGFNIADVKPGAVGEFVGQKPTAAMNQRAEASRVLYDAMDEPWQYMDETNQLVDNRNLDEFRDWVARNGDGSVTAEELHTTLRRFWDEMGEQWAQISGRDIRDDIFRDRYSNEVFTTRRMSSEAREAAKNEGWYKNNIKDGSRLGERLDPNAPAPKLPKGVRDVAYTIKDRVFKPGMEFTWNKGKSKFVIAKPGTIVDGAQAPSVRKQIENFIAKVDPEFASKNTFFDSDVAKVIDGYKSSAGREMIWAGLEEHLITKGILIAGEDVAAANRLWGEIGDNLDNVRKQAKSATGKAQNKRASAARVGAKAKKAMEEGEDLLEQAAKGEVKVADLTEQLDGLDPQIAAIQRTLLNMSEELDNGLVRTADGKFATAPEASRAIEDLFEMAMALEATTRLAQMLRTIGQGITATGQLPPRANRSFQEILTQLKIAKDLMETVKRQAGKLGAQDKAVREVEQLIDGLLGKSRFGMARKDAPKYIQNYVNQVHDIGRLADELEAGIIFNAGYRQPTNVFDISNRKWVKETEARLASKINTDIAATRLGEKLEIEGSIFQSLPKHESNPLYGQLIKTEADRLTTLKAIEEAEQNVLRLNKEAQQAFLRAQRMRGEPRNYGVQPYKRNQFDYEAEALDLESQAAAMESKILQTDELGEVLEQDIEKFVQAENIFKDILGKQQWHQGENALGALKAGLDDGVLPFGPVYARAALGDEVLNQEVLDLMRSMMNVGETELGGLFRVWDSLQGYFKSQAIARPSFVQRNGLGGLFMNLVAGADISLAIKYGRLRERAIQAGWKDALAEAGEVYKGVKNQEGLRQFHRTRPLALKQRAAMLGSRKLVKQGNKEFKDLIKVYESGAIGAGQAASEVAQSFRMSGATTVDAYGRPRRWNPLRRDNVWNTAVRGGNAEMEEFLRGSLAYDSIVNGMDEATTIARVNKYHFNYSKDNMTTVEREYLSRAYPFYTWMRNSIPLMATELARNPRPFLRYLTLKRNIELGVEKDRNMPAWYGQRWGIDLGGLMGNPNQGSRAFAFPDLPFMDLVEFTSGMEGVKRTGMSGLSPLIKTPVELLTGVETFTGRGIKDEFVKPPVAFDVPGLLPFLEMLPGDKVMKNSRGVYGIKEGTLHGLSSFIPYLTVLRRLFPREKRYQDKALTAWISTISPVGYRTPKTVQRDRLSERTRRLIEAREDRSTYESLQRLR